MSDSCDIGIFGLATMGANLARNAARRGYGVAVYNRHADRTDKLIERFGHEGRFKGAHELSAFVASLARPRTVVLVVEAGPAIDGILDELEPMLDLGDVVIDAGNSLFSDTERRAGRAVGRGIHFIGMGMSGGEKGALHGPSLMPGGSREAYERLAPMLNHLAASADGEPCCAYMGPGGAGHYVKMVHNGIEYGMMAAYAEGLNILDKADIGIQSSEHSAEVAPMEEPEYYQFEIDTAKVTELWRRGSVVASWLLDLTAAALEENPTMEGLAGRVSDSGEGRWTVKAAVDLGVPAPVLASSLFERFASRDEDKYANQILSAMRQQFGGHKELPAGMSLEAGGEKADQAGGSNKGQSETA